MPRAIGRIHHARHHGATTALLWREHEWRNWPLGGLDYSARTWRRDRKLIQLCDLLQDLLAIAAGPVDGMTPQMLVDYERMIVTALAELTGAGRSPLK